MHDIDYTEIIKAMNEKINEKRRRVQYPVRKCPLTAIPPS